MKYPCVPLSWKLEETLQLLQLVESENEWSKRVTKLVEIFGDERPAKFFNEKSCKDEFERVMSSGHPEHFIRQQGERYSQKELIHAWIVYLQKQYQIKKAREGELLLVKLREKANLFNRLCSDDCDLTDEEIARLLEQAREEDSKRDQEVVNRELAIGMQKLKELQTLHETNPEKYPALKIIIPPSHPPETSSAAPFSPIKPLFEGLIPPSQIASQAKAITDTSSGPVSPKKVSSPQKAPSTPGSPTKDTLLETVTEILNDVESPPSARTRLRTLSSNSRAPGSVASSASPRRPEAVGSLDNVPPHIAGSEQVFRSPARSYADGSESVVSGTQDESKLSHVEVKMEIDEGEEASRAVEEATEKKETARTRRAQRIRLPSSGGISNAGSEAAAPVQHEHALRTRRSSAASPLRGVTLTKLPDETNKEEKNAGEVEEEGKLRRSERHHAKMEAEASTSNVPARTGRKRPARVEIGGNTEDERKALPVKRRRLSSKDLESDSKKDNKQQIESNIEVQSSPEPEKEEKKNEPEQESDDDKALVDLRTRSRTTRAAAAEEKAKEKTRTSPETPAIRSPRRGAAATRVTRRQTKRGASADGDVEQKPLMITAWRMVSSHRHAAIFAHPVSDRDARGYSRTVRSRMDLSTLKKQLDGGHLQGMKDFKRNILLMFANAVMFNSTGHDVNHYAKEMAADTLSSLKMLQKDVLFVRGTTHMTRRSAAFAAEEAKFERSRFSSPRVTPANSEEPVKEKTSENASREASEIPKSARGGRAAKE